MLFFHSKKGNAMAWVDRWFDWLFGLVSHHESVVFLLALALPFAEAVLPYLSLTMIVGFVFWAMTGSFGVVGAFVATIVFSSIGSALGMILMFGLIRKTVSPALSKSLPKHPVAERFLRAVDAKQAWIVFLFLANPFFPSSILNYLLALSPMKSRKYLVLTLTSRVVVVTLLVSLGSVFQVQEHPVNLLWMTLFYGVVFLIHYLFARRKALID
jgi:uncharacterized membrane protein YdjX (TVP38/TMEM64 family)